MSRSLPWVAPGEPLPDPALAWHEPNGLLAAGLDLSPGRLLEAYAKGIFPWYSDDQPVLWWSPDPRMVLYVDEFRLHRSLARTLRKQGVSARAAAPMRWRITLNRAFDQVMAACAAPRDADGGTWITPQILAAYRGLHRVGHAQSVEVWQEDQLVGGLYGVSIGRMFYGESMFARVSDASKAALAALVATLKRHDFRVIDCQQNTRHLGSLGAREISREAFLGELTALARQPGPNWQAVRIELPDA